MIKIFGHKSPDMDSAGSAVIWAWYLSQIKGQPAQAKLLGSPSNEAIFVFERWGVDIPEIISDVSESDHVVIVDTNNAAELPASIGKASIVEIIDHHLLQGGLSTRHPIPITMRPLACTASIMYDMMGSDAETMPREVRGIMLSCILSDTMEFRSPTTTAHDRAVAEYLGRTLEIDISKYAGEMFAAKSDVSRYSDADLLKLDSKRYDIDGARLRISVLETTNPGDILARKSGLISQMRLLASEEGLDAILVFVVDILHESSTLIVPNERVRSIANKSFSVQSEGDEILLSGIVSRKKQIIPNLKA